MSLRRVSSQSTAAAVEKMMNSMGHGEAVAFARILAAEGMRYTREHESVELAKFFGSRVDELAREVARSAIAKAARGESIETEERAWAALGLIAKTTPADPPDIDADALAEAIANARAAEARADAADQALRNATRSQEDLARYNRDLRGQFSVREADLFGNNYVGPSRPGGGYAGGTMGATGHGPWQPDTYRSMANETYFREHRARPEDLHRPGSTSFRRLQRGAQLMEQTFGPTLPPQAALATQTARYVGNLGPHAAEVVVPTADLTAARYRGTERHEIDPALVTALQQNIQEVPGGAAPTHLEAAATERHRKALIRNQTRHDALVADADRREGMPPGRGPMPVPDYLPVTQSMTETEATRRHEANQARANIEMQNESRAAQAGLTPAQAAEVRAQAKLKLAADNLAASTALETELAAAKVAGARAKLRTMGARRARAVHGYTTDPITGSQPGPGAVAEGDKWWHPGPVLEYWRRQLPAANMNTLQVNSGRVPPSQGMIMARNGTITSQAAGFGDDWYAPFPLKQLNSLKGGEYVRTRTWGGPTTEDIYTGLVHGARAVTVVSHSGTFTVEFDDSLVRGRRFNDKALRMTDRYAQLLDAVRSGQISLESLDPEMERTLEARARGAVGSANPERYRAELKRLKDQLGAKPELSPELKGRVANDWLKSQAADRFRGADADVSVEEAVSAAVNRQASEMVAERKTRAEAEHNPLPSDELTDYRHRAEDQIRDHLRTGDSYQQARNTAYLLDIGPQFDAHMKATTMQVVRGSDPLVLNGRGYKTAMDALKEQFPYYIKDVSYHQWKPNQTGAKDTGYVRPGRNRPAAAMAGLYGHTGQPGMAGGVSGGKVAAESTRYQEPDVRLATQVFQPPITGRGAAISVGGIPVGPGTPGTPGTPGVPGTPGTPPVPGTPGALPEPDTIADLARDANVSMFDELRRQATFGREANDPSGLNVKGQAVIAQSIPPNYPIHAVFNADPVKYRAALSRGEAATEAQFKAVMDWVEQHKYFDFRPEVLAKYKNRGQNRAPELMANRWPELLEPIPHTGYKGETWEGPAFTGRAGGGPDGDPAPTMETVTSVYRSDPDIAPLISEGVEGLRLPDSPDWVANEGQVKRLHAHLVKQQKDLYALAASGGGQRDADEIRDKETRYEVQAKGYAKGLRLATNYADLQAAAASASLDAELRQLMAEENAQRAAPPPPQYEHHVAGVDPVTGELRRATAQEWLLATGHLPPDEDHLIVDQ